ncbi:MAG: AI-2E family transporter [Arcobacteraceae bacterium]
MLQPSNLKYYFFYTAVFVIVIAGLKVASEIVIILLLAVFISSLLSAFLSFLNKKRIPKLISYFFLTLLFIVFISLITYLVNTSLTNFVLALPSYEEKIKSLTLLTFSYLDTYNININKDEILKLLNFNYLFTFTKDIISNLGVILSKLLLITIGVAFILSESKLFNKKLKVIFKNDTKKLISFNLFSHNLQKYFAVKTFTSFLTGLLIYLVLLFFGIQYALLWAFMAFLFNFIPVVGSIVASIPAVLIALVSGNIEMTLWLIIIYVIINISISNIIEPKLMGTHLNLSAMIIFFSLIFWGWVLGIVGMFLAVPITMTIKIAFESSENTKWIGILLSNISQEKRPIN